MTDAEAIMLRKLSLQVSADEIALILSDHHVPDAAYLAVQIANTFDPPSPAQWDAAKVVRLYSALKDATGLSHVAKRNIAMIAAADAQGYARGLEDAARVVERTVVSGPDDDEIDHDDYRDCQMAAHIRSIIPTQEKKA